VGPGGGAGGGGGVFYWESSSEGGFAFSLRGITFIVRFILL